MHTRRSPLHFKALVKLAHQRSRLAYPQDGNQAARSNGCVLKCGGEGGIRTLDGAINPILP